MNLQTYRTTYPKTAEISLPADLGGDDYESVTVFYDYFRADPSVGAPDSIEVCAVFHEATGEEIDAETDRRRIRQACWDDVNDRAEIRAEERAYARARGMAR